MKPQKFKVRDVVTGLRKAGWQPVRRNGSHEVWRSPAGVCVPISVIRPNDEVCHKIFKQFQRAGLDPQLCY